MSPRIWGYLILVLVFLAGGCTAKGRGTGPKPSSPKSQPILQYTDFPNIVIPSGMEIAREKTLVVRTATFVGGVITLRGRVTPESVATFFQKQLVARGWEEVGVIRYKNILLAFRRPNGSCFVYIGESNLGSTQVKIWASQVLGESATTGKVYP